MKYKIIFLLAFMILILLLWHNATSQVLYQRTFVNGAKVETFTIAAKKYIGQPFFDSTIRQNCDVIDSITGGVIDISWTTVGDDGMSGIASGYLLSIKKDSTASTVNIPNTLNTPPNVKEHIQMSLDAESQVQLNIRAYDDANNISDSSNTVNVEAPRTLYKQVEYIQDTSIIVLHTLPDSLKVPTTSILFNTIAIDTAHVGLQNATNLYITPMRRKDNTMNDMVDLTDLSALIWYLTAGSRTSPR